MKNRTVLATIVITMFLFAGCATKHNIVIEPSIESLETQQKAHIAVGAHYRSEFTEYVHTRAFSTGNYIAPIGKASEEMIGQILNKAFDEVTRVEELPPYGERKGDILMVIEPVIEYFDFYVPFDRYEEEKGVTYRFTIYALNGVPVSSWLVTGQAPPDTKLPGHKRIHLFLEDAAGKIINAIERRFGDMDFVTMLKSASDGTAEGQHESLDPESILAEATLITDSERIFQTLGTYLPSEKIALVKLSVANNSGRELLVRPSDTRLELPGGSRLAPACSPAVSSRCEKTTVGVTGMFGPLAGLAAAGGNSKKRAERMDALRNNRMVESTLPHNGSTEGFLYFLVPEETEITGEARLAMWVVEPGSINGVRLHIPILRDSVVDK